MGLLLLQPERGLPDVQAVPYDGPEVEHVAEPDPPESTPPPQDPSPLPPLPVEPQVRQPGAGVEWTSEDRRFSVRLGLRGQVRYAVQDAPAVAPTHSLSLRRARIKLSGHALGEHNLYKLELGLSPRDIGMTTDGPRFTPILDWALEFEQLRDASFRVGQYKLPYGRARMQSSGDLQFVDRSIADGEFNLNRDVGFDVHSYDLLGLGHLRYYAGVFLGEGRDAYRPTNFELVYLGRVEVLPFGQYAHDDHESDLDRLPVPRMSIGAAYAFIDGAARDRGTTGDLHADGGTADLHNATADLSFKFRGFTLLAEAYLRKGKRVAAAFIPPGGLVSAREGYGYGAQAGYVLGPVPLELAGRFSEIRPLGDSPMPLRHQPTAVLGWYFFGHAVKLQLDYSPTWDGAWTNAPSHTVRLQFQAEL